MTSIASGSIATDDAGARHDSLKFISPDIAAAGYFLYSVVTACAPIMRGMSTLILPRSLFLASAAVCIGPAAWLLISPATLFAVYGLTLDSAGIFVGRVLGTAMVALALLFWEARDAAGTPLGALAMRAGLLHNALLVVVIVAATLAGTVTWTGWPAAGLHAAFVCSYTVAFRRRDRH